MGIYINPSDQTKEEWLFNNANVVGAPDATTRHVDADGMLVCLVDNGGFTAAGVAYDKTELEAFILPEDTRSKLWFRVPVAKLYEITGDEIIGLYL